MVTGQDINDFNVLFYYLRRFYSLVRRDFCIFEEVDSLGPPPVLDTMDEEDELHEIMLKYFAKGRTPDQITL